MLTASNRTLGTFTHTHIYLLPVCMKFHCEEKPCFPSHWAFPNPHLPQTKAALPHPKHSPYTLAPSDRLVSQTLELCALLYFLLLRSITSQNPALHSLVFNLSVTLNNNPITSLNSLQDVHLHPPF